MSLLKNIAIFAALALNPAVTFAEQIIQGRLEHVFGENKFGNTVVDQFNIRTQDRARIAVRLSDPHRAERMALSGQRISARISDAGGDGVSDALMPTKHLALYHLR